MRIVHVQNVLRVPIVLFTSIENYPVITITPDTFVDGCGEKYLCAAFTREGPGHYDAVTEKPPGASTKYTKKDRCLCGANNKEVKPVCCDTVSSSGRP